MSPISRTTKVAFSTAEKIDVPGFVPAFYPKLVFCCGSHHGRDLLGNVDQQADPKRFTFLAKAGYSQLIVADSPFSIEAVHFPFHALRAIVIWTF
jgi:hypothetical protein